MKNYRMMVARCTPNGHLDTTFGASSGKTIFSLPDGMSSRPFGLETDQNGRIVMAGTAGSSFPNERMALARFTSNGQPDVNFGPGQNGMVVISESPGTRAGGADLAILPNGKIVVTGLAEVNGKTQFALARCNPFGKLDITFGPNGNGKTLIDFGADAWGWQLALDSNGRLVVAGSAQVNGKTRFALARCHANGHLDTTFGSQHNGKAVIIPPSQAVTTAMRGRSLSMPTGALS